MARDPVGDHRDSYRRFARHLMIAVVIALTGVPYPARPQQAVAAYRKAFYHFDRDRATTERQAFALVRLGELLESLGKRMESCLTFEQAIALDPRHAADHPGVEAVILEPLAPLRLLT